ncbi:MAG: hypothetical protein ABI986_12105 [Chloroflexota bacterium]
MNHLVEFRSLNLKPGTREEFQRFFLEEAMSFLQHDHRELRRIRAGTG